MLQLYYAPRTRSRRVLWCLEEIGQPFDRNVLNLRAGEHKKSAYLAINPSGKVPALVDGEEVITESAAICMYLADKYADARLAPAVNSPHRGEYLRWMFFAVGVLEPSFTDKRLGRAVTPKTGWSDADDVLTVVSQAMQNVPFLVGKSFSAADIMVGSMLIWADSEGLIREDAVLGDYVKRLTCRPAYLNSE